MCVAIGVSVGSPQYVSETNVTVFNTSAQAGGVHKVKYECTHLCEYGVLSLVRPDFWLMMISHTSSHIRIIHADITHNMHIARIMSSYVKQIGSCNNIFMNIFRRNCGFCLQWLRAGQINMRSIQCYNKTDRHFGTSNVLCVCFAEGMLTLWQLGVPSRITYDAIGRMSSVNIEIVLGMQHGFWRVNFTAIFLELL